jgi:predicted HTH domain antitoxin
MSTYQSEHLEPVRQESEYCNLDLDRLEWCAIEVAHVEDEEWLVERETPFAMAQSLKVDLAVRSYEKGSISLGRAAEIADLPYGKMAETLRERGVPLRFGASVEVAEKRSKKLVDKLKEIRGRS